MNATRICSVQLCDRVFYALGYCRMHYVRQAKHGTTELQPKRPRIDLALRFEMHTERDGECLVWTGSRDRDGYGQMEALGMRRAHRVAYVVAHGPIPDDLIVRHTCDNPPCVEPSHLIVGTHWDNSQDKVKRDRSTVGERNAGAKLTASEVKQIRSRLASGETHIHVAGAFSISKTTVGRISRNESWWSV